MLKCYHLGGKRGAHNPPKGPKTWSARGGGPINYDNDDDNDNDDDDDDKDDNDGDDDYDVFS